VLVKDAVRVQRVTFTSSLRSDVDIVTEMAVDVADVSVDSSADC